MALPTELLNAANALAHEEPKPHRRNVLDFCREHEELDLPEPGGPILVRDDR